MLISRHCPFGHFNLKINFRSAKIKQPVLLLNKNIKTFSETKRIKLLLWSGGKKSYLTKLLIDKDQDKHSKLMLVTLINKLDGQLIDNSQFHIYEIMEQTKKLKINLLVIPIDHPDNQLEVIQSLNNGLKYVHKFIFDKAKSDVSFDVYFGDIENNELHQNITNSLFKDSLVNSFPLKGFKDADLPNIIDSMDHLSQPIDFSQSSLIKFK